MFVNHIVSFCDLGRLDDFERHGRLPPGWLVEKRNKLLVQELLLVSVSVLHGVDSAPGSIGSRPVNHALELLVSEPCLGGHREEFAHFAPAQAHARVTHQHLIFWLGSRLALGRLQGLSAVYGVLGTYVGSRVP